MKSGTFKTSTEPEKQTSLLTEAEEFVQEIKPQQVAKAEPVMSVSLETHAQSMPSPVNDVQDTVNSFLEKIAVAQSNGLTFIETTPQVFDHYMRGQKTAYFYYQGVRVYKHGEREAIEERELRTI